MDPGMVISVRADLVSEQMGDDMVVLDPVGDRYVRLNRVGALLWQALEQGPSTVADLNALVVRRFGLDPGRAEEDVAAFLSMLRERELIGLDGASGAAGAEEG